MVRFDRIQIAFNGRPTPRVQRYLDIFCEEVARRSRLKPSWKPRSESAGYEVLVTLDADLGALDDERATAVRDELASLPAPGPDGFRIATFAGRDPLVVIAGADERSLLYGLGRLLRKLEIRETDVRLPAPLRFSTTPKARLRGHQLGYRPKTNAYDMWSRDQYAQYIRELALFGVNAIELLPPRTVDEPRTDDMLYDQLEMMIWLSGEIHSLGLAVWIWYPNMSDDFASDGTIALESAERDEVFSALPHVDVVMIPGGDPGDQEPSVLFNWGRIQAGILKKHHPHAELWISGQIFDATPAWQGAFFRELGKEPEWLGGVCHGPWVKGDVREFRASVPVRYGVRRYPDITHSLSCQYPVRDWDPVFAITLGRECYNPRPVDFKRIQNEYADDADGSLTYSEGINDDVNKFVWTDQDWDPSTPVRETLRDFARLFVSPDAVDEIADGLLGFERNWRGPVDSNEHIAQTFATWRGLEERLGATVKTNYRLVMPLMRAYYDEYVRRRRILEKGLEERVVSILEAMTPQTTAEAIASAREIIASAYGEHEFDWIKRRCVELADLAFELIRWQTSVVRHRGQAIVRGAFLDAIDFPVSDLMFYDRAIRDAESAGDPAAVFESVKASLRRARPFTDGRFVDLRSVEDREEVQLERSWEDDPSGQTLPYVVNIPARFPRYGSPDEGEAMPPLVPMVERSFASTMYCRPLRLRFAGLNPSAAYRLRACYVTYRRNAGLRLFAGGKEVHGFIVGPDVFTTVSYELPEGSVGPDGVLELAWQAKPFRVYSEGVAWAIVEKR